MIFTQKGVTQHTELLKQDGISEAGARSRAAGISGFGSPPPQPDTVGAPSAAR